MSPRISATSFGKYDKTVIFVKILQKKRKNASPVWPPDTPWERARAPCAPSPLAAPLRLIRPGGPYIAGRAPIRSERATARSGGDGSGLLEDPSHGFGLGPFLKY